MLYPSLYCPCRTVWLQSTYRIAEMSQSVGALTGIDTHNLSESDRQEKIKARHYRMREHEEDRQRQRETSFYWSFVLSWKWVTKGRRLKLWQQHSAWFCKTCSSFLAGKKKILWNWFLRERQSQTERKWSTAREKCKKKHQGKKVPE